MTGKDRKPPLSVEELMRLYPETAGGFIRSILTQGRRIQHLKDVEFIENWGFIGKESPRIWKGFGLQGLQAFKEMKIE